MLRLPADLLAVELQAGVLPAGVLQAAGLLLVVGVVPFLVWVHPQDRHQVCWPWAAGMKINSILDRDLSYCNFFAAFWNG